MPGIWIFVAGFISGMLFAFFLVIVYKMGQNSVGDQLGQAAQDIVRRKGDAVMKQAIGARDRLGKVGGREN